MRTYICTYAHTHTLFFWLTNHLKQSVKITIKQTFLKHQNTKFDRNIYMQHLGSNILNPGSI